MTLQDLIDHATLNEIPFDTEIYLHHFTTGFEPAHLRDPEEHFEGEEILSAWPAHAIVLSNQAL